MEAITGAPRGELLEWINSTLKLNLHKIEETASGAVACQIIDMMFPDTLPLQRVNFAAKDAYEYSKNYKILQSAFLKNKIDKNIDVERLIKGRPQDNLEFMQWLKKFYDQHPPQGEYNPEERRSACKGGKDGIAISSTHIKPANLLQKHSSQPSLGSPSRGDCLSPSYKRQRINSSLQRSTSTKMEQEIEELKQLLNEKEALIQKQQLEIQDLESERDYYNRKLVDIDDYIMNVKDISLQEACQTIKEILYKEISQEPQEPQEPQEVQAQPIEENPIEQPVQPTSECI